MQTRLDTVKKTKEAQQSQLAEVRAAIEAEKAARPETVSASSIYHVGDSCELRGMIQEERAIELEKLGSLKRELDALNAELAKYGACDPVKVEEKKRALILAKEAAVRWTGKFGHLKTLVDSEIACQITTP